MFLNSINVFRYPSKKIRRLKVTNYFASDEIFYRRLFLLTKFFADFLSSDKIVESTPSTHFWYNKFARDLGNRTDKIFFVDYIPTNTKASFKVKFLTKITIFIETIHTVVNLLLISNE